MVYGVRQECGRQLVLEVFVEVELVSIVLELVIFAVLGYFLQIGIFYVEVFIKNRYVGRIFIQFSDRFRKFGVVRKFGLLLMNFKGKRVVLIDDFIVRGNIMGFIIKFLKQVGVREVSYVRQFFLIVVNLNYKSSL